MREFAPETILFMCLCVFETNSSALTVDFDFPVYRGSGNRITSLKIKTIMSSNPKCCIVVGLEPIRETSRAMA